MTLGTPPSAHTRLPLAASLALTTLLLTWWALAAAAGSDYFPAPQTVLKEMGRLFSSGEIFPHLAATLGRIAVGFLAALLSGLMLAFLMRLNRTLHRFIQFYVTLGLTIPVLSWSVISIMLFGLDGAAAVFTAWVICMPVIATTFFEGMKSLDRDLTEVAKVYHLPRVSHLRHVVLPQLLPYLFAATRTGWALAWKTIVITEAFGLTSGIGYQISYAFGLLSMKGVLAWTLLFTATMVVLEYALLQPLERRLFHWRQASQP